MTSLTHNWGSTDSSTNASFPFFKPKPKQYNVNFIKVYKKNNKNNNETFNHIYIFPTEYRDSYLDLQYSKTLNIAQFRIRMFYASDITLDSWRSIEDFTVIECKDINDARNKVMQFIDNQKLELE